MEEKTLVEDPIGILKPIKHDPLGILSQKKNPIGNDLSSTIPSSSTGLNPFQNSQENTDLSPVLPQHRDELRQQQEAQSQAMSDRLQNITKALDPEHREAFQQAQQITASRPADAIRQPGERELAHDAFMQTPVGKAMGAVQYLGSKATKGTLQIARGVSHLAQYVGNPVMAATGQDQTKDFFDKADENTNFGLTKGDISRIENGNGMGSHALAAAGMAAEFAPTIMAGGETNLPKTFLYLQGLGQGAETADKLQKQGANLNPVSKELLIQGTGVVNMALEKIGDNIFGKMPASVRGSVVNGIVADAIKESAGKDLTQASYKELLDNGVKMFADKFEKAPIDAISHYNETAKTLTKLNTGNYLLHKAVDATNDKPVFNETLGDLADQENKTLTQDAPTFAAIPALGEMTKLFPGSSYKNDVVENIVKDPSPENVDATKQALYNHGFAEDNPNKWTPQEMDATFKHVDKIAEVVKTLPPSLDADKKAKAMELIMGRNDLTEQLKTEQDKRKALDPSIQDVISPKEQFITDKIEQANDKIKSLVTGQRSTYSKGISDEEGKFFKTTDGKQEDITPERYQLEKMERDAKAKKNEQAEPNAEVPSKIPTNESTGEETAINPTNETTENTPIKPTENESTNEGDGKVSSPQSDEEGSPQSESGNEKGFPNEEKVVKSGEDKTKPESTKPNEDDNKTTPRGDNNTGATERTPAEVQDKPNEEKNGEEKPEGTEVKKTILTKRAYEGEVQADVKKHLEDKGLTRSSFTQEERSKQATDFIDKFGEEAAHHAVESGDVEGGMAASILAQLQIRNSRAMAELPDGSDEREALAKNQADIISLMEKKGYLGGEFNGQLAHEYQNAELDYANVKKQVEGLTGKPMTEAQEKRAKELTGENEKLKTQLQEAEAKLIEETDKAFNEGVESAKNETKSEKAKRIANSLRKNAKLHKPNIFSSASPATLAWDAAIEIVAKSIETGGKLADAIDAGIEHIKKTDWYKSLHENRKIFAEKEFKRFNNDHSGSTDLADLQERFVDKKDNKFSPDEARDIWGYMKENYLNEGSSYRDAVSKTAEDLGLSWRQVSEAVITPKLKRQSDEMWKRQADYTRNRTAIKDWVGEQNKSKVGKVLKNLSGLFRGVAVFGHGGIFMGTHAGMTLFNPSTWNKTIPAFFRGWKYAYGNEANFERSMEELKHSPNYLIAQRAGLKNNADRINTEEYQKSQHYLGKLGMAGEKGFNAVKVLRQDLFDYHFNKLTPVERDDPNVAKNIAHLVNLATGATNLKLPSWVNEASFAGGMEAARWEKLTVNPVKASEVALNALFNPSKASTADKVFAKVWARRVGEQLATYSALLLANSAIQNTLNPKNTVNYTNPNKPDYMKFKFGDVTIDPTSGMRGVAMFMRTLGKIPFESKKELHGDKRIAVVGKDIANYGRGKLAPLYSTAADIFGGTDFNGNVMPYSKDKPNKGKHKLTWGEYGWSKAPLPIAEAANVAYQSAVEHGAHKPTLEYVLRGIMSGAISGTTGFRVGEYDSGAPKNKKNK